MGYIKDTCIFIRHIKSNLKLFNTISICSKNNKKIYITNVILDELRPPKRILNQLPINEQNEKSGLYMAVKTLSENNYNDNFINININKHENIKKNYDSLRERYYSHLKDPEFVRKAVHKGDITLEEFQNKSFIYKDQGECSCIALAMEYNHLKIVTHDKGRIFLKPHFNLFDSCRELYDIDILNYDEWVEEVNSK